MSQSGIVKTFSVYILLVAGASAAAVGMTWEAGQTSAILFQHASAAPYDLSSAEFVAMSPDLAEGSMMTDIEFSANGKQLFALGYGYGVYQFSLTTPFDITTLSDREAAFPAAKGTTGTYTVGSMAFSTDGTKLFLNGQPPLVKYELSTPYQLYNFSVINEESTTGNFVSRPYTTTLYAGIELSPDGEKMFLVNEQDSKIYEYAMSSAYNLTTARLTGHTVTVPDAYPAGLDFSADGTKMIVLGWEHNAAYQYTLGTGFDLSTAGSSPASSITNIHKIDGATRGVQGVSFSSDGGKVFILTIKAASSDGNSGYYYKVYEYHMDITPPVPVITTTATSPASADRIPITVDFGEPVTFDPGTGVSRTQGDITNIHTQNNNQTFTFDIANLTDGTMAVSIPAGEAVDMADNPSRASDTLAITINRTAAEPDDYFVTTWSIAANDRTITIPVGGSTGTYTVHWGDGTSSADVSGDQSHTYESAGDYTVRISGDFARISMADSPASAAKLKSIDQWGAMRWSSMASAFRDASNMIYNATDSPDLSGVSDMSDMFRGASSFNGDISAWDVSSVTDMGGMFHHASSFNGDISGWDVSSVTDMGGMFHHASSFNGDISAWDVSSVTEMYDLFNGASSFNGDISGWDVSSVTEMNDLFATASSFNGDISAWNTSSVIDMRHMFVGASSFNGDISAWDVSSVAVMDQMFLYTFSFNQNLGPWYITLNSTRIHDGSYAADIVAQNSFLRDHNPSYSLAVGTACADNANFTITGGILTINSAPAQDSYSICIGASGSSLFGTGNARQITLNVNTTVSDANRQPVADAGTAQTVREGAAVQLDGSASSDPDGDQLSYNWTAPSGITLRNDNTVTPSFTAPDRTSSYDYPFTLTVSDGTATDTDSVIVTVKTTPPETTTPTPPAAPTNLRATSTTDTVTITWDDPGDDDIAGYKILSRVISPQTTLSVLVNDTGSASTASYTASNLQPDTAYAFRVVALSDHGESPYSAPVDISTKRPPPPAAPTNLRAAPTTDTVTLTWDDPNDTTIECYKILSRIPAIRPDLHTLVNDTGSAAASYTISNLRPDTAYVFRITAMSDYGESSWSKPVSISTLPDRPPAIVLAGQANTTVQVGSAFTEPGYTATDDYDGDITANVMVTGTVDTSTIGTYTLRYDVADSSGNAAETQSRTVRVVDTTPPVITLSGQANTTVQVGSAFTEPGYTATDDYDGDITANVMVTGTVDTSTIGTYTLRYDVADSSGNAAETQSRTVHVVDTTPPVITLSGPANTTVQVGSAFTEPGYTATDDYDGDITANVMVTGTVDTSTIGTYTLRYDVADSSGNAAVQQTKTVTVIAAAPAAPTNLAATSTTDTVTITWDDPNDATITGYKILSRVLSPQTTLSVLVADTGSAASSHTISNLEPDTAYVFRVVALSDHGESPYSAPVDISTKRLPPPAAPTNLEATSTTDTVTIIWDDPNDTTITGYKILARASATQFHLSVLVADTGSAASSHTISNLEPDTAYVFRVVALSDQGASDTSRPVSVSTLPDG